MSARLLAGLTVVGLVLGGAAAAQGQADHADHADAVVDVASTTYTEPDAFATRDDDAVEEDTRHCVTANEFDQLHDGMTRAAVRRMWDGKGHRVVHVQRHGWGFHVESWPGCPDHEVPTFVEFTRRGDETWRVRHVTTHLLD